MALKAFKTDSNKIIKGADDDKADKMVVNSSKLKKLKNNKSENLMYVLNIRAIGEPIFLIFNTKKTFNQLK